MEGFLFLHRQILDSPIFNNPQLLKFWIYCLCKASHKEHDFMVGLQEVKLKKGEFVFGRKVASNDLKITESSAYKYLNVLKKMNMISLNSNNKFSLVTIVNWEFYQGDKINSNNKVTTKEQQSNNKVTTKEQQSNTNNNVDKDYNVDNENNGDKIKDIKPTVIKIDELLKAFSFSESLQSKIKEWFSYKKEKRQEYKPTGAKSLMTQIHNKLKELSEEQAIYAITESMACNYQGIIWDKAKNYEKGGTYGNTGARDTRKDIEPPKRKLQGLYID